MLDQKYFPVLYQNEYFIINPSLLYNSSSKFKELVDKVQDLQSIHLKINYDKFTSRNINNFLDICQNEPTDVQDSELKEICYIAKMFGAGKIYNTALDFVRTKIDPCFYVSDFHFAESNGNQYLILEPNDGDSPIHHADLGELEFDDVSDSTETNKVENNNNNNNSNTPDENNKTSESTSCYQIIVGKLVLKSGNFNLLKDNKIIYTAKLKNDEIFIGEGKNLNAARITRKRDGYNIVETNDQEFKINYVNIGDKYSLSLSFNHDGRQLQWIPKVAKKLSNFKGGFKHIPIQSKKNIILQNRLQLSTFILRKMSQKMFEAECNPAVNPLIVFAIALSEIVGPM